MLKYLGPGILLAGAAIGGSHLVASTQAGAQYGWSLLGILFLVNLFKYPFFKYAQQYTAATGENILEGYLRIGKRYLILFFVLSIFTGIINIAGVSMITGSLATNFGLSGLSVPVLSGIIMIICVLIIWLGGFGLLRSFGRIVVVVLAISTIAAMLLSVANGPVAPEGFQGDSPWTLASFGFIIMFMGWMPAPIDVSVWPSLWMKSQEELQHKASVMRETQIDFHAGYIGTVILAFVFLILGKMVMYGSGEEFSPSSAVFAHQLIDLYAISMGEWARSLIIVVAFSAMFSTSFTTIDGYPRSLATCMSLLFKNLNGKVPMLHHLWLVAGIIVAFLIIHASAHLGSLLAIAMIISFVTAPIFALLNYRAIRGKNVPAQYQPRRWERVLSVFGVIFLGGFSLVFFYWYFFMV